MPKWFWCCSSSQHTVRNILARHAFRAAGLCCDIEVPFLLPGASRRPADWLVQRLVPPAGYLPTCPTAYGITSRSLYRAWAFSSAAHLLAGAAEAADAEELRAHTRHVRAAFHFHSEAASYAGLPFCQARVR